jgi:hypothetical protein
MRDSMLLDAKLVRENALAQGIRLSELTLIYDGLSPLEEEKLARNQEIVKRSGSMLIAKWPKHGLPLFEEKAQVLTLGA